MMGMSMADIGGESRRRMGAVAQATPAKASKYRSTRVKVDGIGFHSKKEAARFSQLLLQVKAGNVVRFHRQVVFDLPGPSQYRCDFLIFFADDRVVYEDVKGFKTAEYVLKKKMVKALYGVDILES